MEFFNIKQKLRTDDKVSEQEYFQNNIRHNGYTEVFNLNKGSSPLGEFVLGQMDLLVAKQFERTAYQSSLPAD